MVESDKKWSTEVSSLGLHIRHPFSSRVLMNDSHSQIRRAVAAVVIDKGRFLVVRRSQSVRAPGLYCFPGGHIEEGESEAEAVCREMREELSVACFPQKAVWRCVTSWGIDVAWWLAHLAAESQLVANPEEIAEVHWLTPEEMNLRGEMLESNELFLGALDRGEIELAIDR